MSIRKQYLKDKAVCKVTFSLPKKAAKSAKTVHVVGEFNGWDMFATPMKKKKNGVFAATVDLDLGREYQFRYLIDEANWDNDSTADKYVPTPFGDSQNSVIVV